MVSRHARMLVLTMGAVVLLTAGCGGGGGGAERLSKADYQAKAKQIARDLQAKFADASNVNPSDIGAVTDLMNRLGDAVDTAADQFDHLNPPEEVQAAQDKLVDAAHELADKAREIAGKLKNSTLEELSSIQNELDITKSTAFKKLQEAVEEFKAKGYDLGNLTR